MGDGLRTARLLTTDESLLATARAAVGAMEGWELENPRTQAELLQHPPAPGDAILVDGNLKSANCYEVCRALTGKSRARVFVVVDQGNKLGESLAHFAGASGVLRRPMSAADLRKALDKGPRPELPDTQRGKAAEPALPDKLLTDLMGAASLNVVGAITDSETGLFSYAFLKYKLDEEFKRAQRFGHPLACVMMGFEGEASEEVLRALASIFLNSARDTDVLGRFDQSSFLFFLPNTGPDGAEVMARRVGQSAQELKLRDLVGDELHIAVGISFFPHPEIRRREDLFDCARKAFFEARQAGGGVVTKA